MLWVERALSAVLPREIGDEKDKNAIGTPGTNSTVLGWQFLQLLHVAGGRLSSCSLQQFRQ